MAALGLGLAGVVWLMQRRRARRARRMAAGDGRGEGDAQGYASGSGGASVASSEAPKGDMKREESVGSESGMRVVQEMDGAGVERRIVHEVQGRERFELAGKA